MKKTFSMLFALTGLTGFAATATSPVVEIDLRSPNVLTAPSPVGYSPLWTGSAADSGAHVEILAVFHEGQQSASTQVLYSGAADEEGLYPLTLPEDGARTFRLIHRTKLGDETLGELVADVALAAESPSSAETYANTTAEKLDGVAAVKRLPTFLTYSDLWTEGTASIVIDHLERTKDGAEDVKVLYSSAAPGEGKVDFTPFGAKGSECLCRLHAYDAGGNEIGDPLTAFYNGRIAGFLLLFR